MTPTEQAARWLADVPRRMIEDGGDYLYHGKRTTYLPEAAALAAIARHLAPGDDLVAQATAALEGVTPGKPCQFHPSYCKEAEGTPFSEWDSSHDLSVILPDGKRYKIGHFRHSADAGFDQFARQWVPEAAARLSALTAERDELKAWKRYWQGEIDVILAGRSDSEDEVATLRDRLARMEGALDPEDAFNKADWFWRAMDPDDCGDSPEEAINRAMVGRFCVCEIASSYAGPTRYGFIAPVLDPESDDEEFVHFATQQEAIDAAKARAALTDGGSNG